MVARTDTPEGHKQRIHRAQEHVRGKMNAWLGPVAGELILERRKVARREK